MRPVTPAQPRRGFRFLTSLVVMSLLAVSLPGCRTLLSNAKGRVSNVKANHDVGMVQGELDAGITVTVTVTNVGQAGFINVKPAVSTSEGEWSRSQNLHFGAGETKTLTYFFSEPTINATNIQYRIDVYPMADR